MNEAALGASFVLGAGLILATAGVVSVVLYRTAKFAPQAMVAVSVSILTLVAIFAATASSSENISTALISLAGVGLGALAGALRALFDAQNAPPRDTEPLRDDENQEPGGTDGP